MPPYFITLLTMEIQKRGENAHYNPTGFHTVRFCGFQSVFAVSGNAAFACAAKASGGGCYNSQFAPYLRQVLINFMIFSFTKFLKNVFAGFVKV
ncbi:Uncharacterised protein [Neisseria gonorrhoeae]|uniref:Uncharacterized protein n=1 Tax=Neisseria gonorrhoeae TaxID=485 RepID=A0A378VU84_NEIGO|nr:Uncharacterised protein [Neisseria gonorrhoeae]